MAYLLKRSTAPAPVLQRCGAGPCDCSAAEQASHADGRAETTDGPADRRPVQRQSIPPAADPAQAAPADPTQVPADSQYARMDPMLLEMLQRTFRARVFWGFTAHPTLVQALDHLGAEHINTLVQLKNRLFAAGLWQHVDTIRSVWTTSSLGIDFNGTSMQTAVDTHPNFCKDTMVGEAYHHGASCWRETVPANTPGLHFCAPDSVHVDPHQTSVGRLPGVLLGGDSLVSFGPVCRYSLIAFVSHMADVEGGRAVNVFHRAATARDQISAQLARARRLAATHADAARHVETLTQLSDRRLQLDPTLRGWSIQGMEAGDAGTQARHVNSELDAIEGQLFTTRLALDEIEHPTTITPGTD